MNSNYSDEQLDDIVSRIQTGQNKTQNNVNLEDIDYPELKKSDPNTAQAYKDFYTGTINFYKIVGAQPTDSDDIVRRKCKEKLSENHPDKMKKKLKALPVEKQESERKRIEQQYKLVYEAYNIFRDSEKRKAYDLQMKTIKSKNFFTQKNSFDEFRKLQNSEINENGKQSASAKFELAGLELDKEHGFKRNMLDEYVTEEDAKRKFDDLQIERDQQDIEYEPVNKFNGKLHVSLTEFNKEWERQQKRKSKKSNKDESTIPSDRSIIKWDGIGASNDYGTSGTTNYTSIESNYDGLYSTEKFNSSEYASVIHSDSEDDYNSYESDSDNNIDVSYVNGHIKKNRNDLEKSLKDFEQKRNMDLEANDGRSIHDSTWRGVMENPFNVSSQMDTMIGNEIKALSYKTKPRTHVNKDVIDAYKSMVYDADDIE